jgi:hypothetical protein
LQTPWHCLPERSAPSRPTIRPKRPSPRGCHRCLLLFIFLSVFTVDHGSENLRRIERAQYVGMHSTNMKVNTACTSNGVQSNGLLLTAQQLISLLFASDPSGSLVGADRHTWLQDWTLTAVAFASYLRNFFGVLQPRRAAWHAGSCFSAVYDASTRLGHSNECSLYAS